MKRALAILVVLSGCGSNAPAPAPAAVAKPAPVMEAPKAAPPAPAPAPAPEAPANPDLLVHLRLDGPGSDPAGVVRGKVEFGPGKIGQAAILDGKGGHIEIPSTPELDALNLGDFTIAAWFKPADVPPGKEAESHANYGILNKAGWHEGIRYGNDRKFVFEHWLAGPKPEEPEWKGAGTWEAEYEPGQWYHVVGVVDRKGGATKLYVNGELISTGDWDAGAKARDYGKTTWKAGHAAPGAEQWAWPAKGMIDDVRLYKKALSDTDVAALHKEGSK